MEFLSKWKFSIQGHLGTNLGVLIGGMASFQGINVSTQVVIGTYPSVLNTEVSQEIGIEGFLCLGKALVCLIKKHVASYVIYTLAKTSW